MTQVAALTSGNNIPSTLFRVRQHVSTLSSFGIDVREYTPRIQKYQPIPGWPKNIKPKYGLPIYLTWEGIKLSTRMPGMVASWRSEITWLERSLLPGYLTLEPLLKKPFVFDMDDAIWLVSPFGAKAVPYIVKRAAAVVTGNEYLAEWVRQYTPNVEIIPTAVDLTEYIVDAPMGEKNGFVVGWIGTGTNLAYLEQIEHPLQQFLATDPNIRLMVISSEPPLFREIDPSRVTFVKWERETAAHYMRQMDVGIMPLPDTAWTRGKCSFKMLQYMAAGLPVVVSPIGMNQDILNMGEVGLPASSDEEWFEALMIFYQQREMGVACGKNGRQIVEQHFSQAVIAQKLAQVFKSLS